jgi:hypothetical protein
MLRIPIRRRFTKNPTSWRRSRENSWRVFQRASGGLVAVRSGPFLAEMLLESEKLRLGIGKDAAFLLLKAALAAVAHQKDLLDK